MKVNSLIMGIIGIVVCAIMVGGALLPAVSSAIDNEKTIVNNNSTYYRAAIDGEYRVIADNVGFDFTVNGVSYDVPYGIASQIITTDNLIVRMSQEPTIRVQYFKDGTLTNIMPVTSFDFTVSSDRVIGSYVTENGTTDVDVPISWGFVFTDSKTADYVYYDAYYEHTININDISQVYGSNVIDTTNQFFSFNGSNLYVNGVKNDSMTFELSKVAGYVDRYTFTYSTTADGVTFEVDNNGSPYTVHPYYIIVPKSIMVTATQNVPIVTMLETIPIIAIAGLVMAGIYVFISRK